MVMKRIVVATVCCVAFAAVVWAQGLVICRACGREAKPGETACSHCSAQLPKASAVEAKRPEPAAPAVDTDAEVARAATAVVGNSLRRAREQEKSQPEVALSYYQNALALMRLVPAKSLPAGVGEEILAGNERVLQMMLRGQVPCRKCEGTGKYQLDMSKVDRKQGIKAVDGVACPACRGQGRIAGFRDVSKVKMAILQGRQEFERRQMVDGDVRVGRALVPAALDQLLNNRQRALVMTGMPVPCGTCQLSGRQKCTACKGTGWENCDNEGCKNGVLEAPRQPRTRTAKRIGEEQLKKCPTCGGLGEVPCVACKGFGSVVCKDCDGSGQAPRCSRCTGTGITACSKCKGTGELKGKPCPECKGEKVSLCSACRGEGAVAR